MSESKPKPGSFLPYLEFEQRNKKPVPEPAAASPMALLEILSQQTDQSCLLCDLQTRSQMDPRHYRDAVRTLRDAGYVSVEGPPLDEVVHLTEKGAEVARLARPA